MSYTGCGLTDSHFRSHWYRNYDLERILLARSDLLPGVSLHLLKLGLPLGKEDRIEQYASQQVFSSNKTYLVLPYIESAFERLSRSLRCAF